MNSAIDPKKIDFIKVRLSEDRNLMSLIASYIIRKSTAKANSNGIRNIPIISSSFIIVD